MGGFILGYRFFRKICAIVLKSLYTTKVFGLDNIPGSGACIICVNHTSLLDPPLIGTYITRDLRYMGKEELFNIPVIGWILRDVGVIPVKRGIGDVGAVKTAIKVLKEGSALVMYPEGTRAKKGQSIEAKAGAALIAVKAKVPIIPVAIIGNYKLFSEMKVSIGKEINLDEYYNKKLAMDEYSQISNEVMDRIKELAKEHQN